MYFSQPLMKCESTFRRLTNVLHFREQQRAQKVFKAQVPLDLASAKNKLLGFGMQLLDGIDPNPDNMVCAGIIHTQGQQVGCLLRLEPNRQAQVRFVAGYNHSALTLSLCLFDFPLFLAFYSMQTCDFSDVPVNGSVQQGDRY